MKPNKKAKKKGPPYFFHFFAHKNDAEICMSIYFKRLRKIFNK
jgi:hypothetical protein